MSVKTWSAEQEQELAQLYVDEDIKNVHQLALHFDKGYRSVISKLVQMKIYIKPVPEEDPKAETVKIMLRELETTLGIQIEGTNLNKKENLTKVIRALRVKLKNK